jgi:hypothetical protein
VNTSTEQFDLDAQEQSEARVVNISDEVVRLEIAQQAGSKPRRYALGPYGSGNESISIQIGYTQPFRGAGRGLVQATIETLTEREVITEIPPTIGSNGTVIDHGRRPVRISLVVHEDRAEEMRARYVEALAKLGQKAKTVKSAATHQAWSTPPESRQTRKAEAPIEDLEDQGSGALDEPPPDDDLPPAVIAPEPVTVGKRKGG